MNPISLEVCIDSIESGLAAQAGGASRVELCSELISGGVTPSAGIIEITRKRLTIDLHVIIRPRGGDFYYSDEEFEVMKRDILLAKQLGVNGVALGVLQFEGSVDVNKTKELVILADPLSVTFHRAFDLTPDPFKAINDVIACGCNRILTSGKVLKAEEGIPLIKKLVEVAGKRLSIMPASGISLKNVRRIVTETGVSEIHAGHGVSDLIEEPEDGIFHSFRRVVNPNKVREMINRVEGKE